MVFTYFLIGVVVIGRLLGWLTDWFIFDFASLTAFYILFFTVAIAFARWARGGDSFRQRYLQAVGDLLGDNNRQWCYLVMMIVLTLIIAFGTAGEPLLPKGIHDLPQDLLGQNTHQQVKSQWEYLMFGYKPPAWYTRIPTPADTDWSYTWFFWKAWGWYLALLIPFSVYAFHDEVIAGFRAAVNLLKERRQGARQAAAQVAAQPPQRGRRGQQPPPQQPVTLRQFWTLELIFDLFSAFLAEFIVNWRFRRGAQP